MTIKSREFASPPINGKGGCTHIWYGALGQTTSAELFSNYANEPAAQGFTTLYESFRDAAFGKWNDYMNPYGSTDGELKTSRSPRVLSGAPMADSRTLSAQRVKDAQMLYVHLVVVQWDKDNATFKAKRGAYSALGIYLSP